MQAMEFAVEGLDLEGKTILDAAVGAGRATAFWAKKLSGIQANSRIIGVDIDLSPEWEEKIKGRLGPDREYVELVEADIFDLDFLDNGSVDIIDCGDTIIFLNERPLQLLRAFEEFKRVLAPGGYLIITSEFSTKDLEKEEGQWQRWQLSQSISQLAGKTFSVEPGPREVKRALEILNFEVIGQKEFPPVKIDNYREIMDEWKEIWLKEVEKLPWEEKLRKTMAEEINSVYGRVMEAGYLIGPGKFIIKARKGLAGGS